MAPADGLTPDRNGGDPSRVVSAAVALAAGRLGLSSALLGRIIGLSGTAASQLRAGNYRLARGSKSYELAVLLLRLFRGLGAILNDDGSMRSWLRSHNLALGGRPIEMIGSVTGLMSVISYIDSRRMPV